jgi:hypothetical protein
MGKYVSATQTSNLSSPEPTIRVRQVWKFRVFALLDTKNLGNDLVKCWVWGGYIERRVGTELTEIDSGAVT